MLWDYAPQLPGYIWIKNINLFSKQQIQTIINWISKLEKEFPKGLIHNLLKTQDIFHYTNAPTIKAFDNIYKINLCASCPYNENIIEWSFYIVNTNTNEIIVNDYDYIDLECLNKELEYWKSIAPEVAFNINKKNEIINEITCIVNLCGISINCIKSFVNYISKLKEIRTVNTELEKFFISNITQPILDLDNYLNNEIFDYIKKMKQYLDSKISKEYKKFQKKFGTNMYYLILFYCNKYGIWCYEALKNIAENN